MPYIITTKRPNECPSRVGFADDMRVTGRRAVATLEEARDGSIDIVRHAGPPVGEYFEAEKIANRLPESGGTVGPLPDGTLIEVERKTWKSLAEQVWEHGRDHYWPSEEAEIIDAYNAQ
jgi:hypothetical protein